jgi:hypothetical protein
MPTRPTGCPANDLPARRSTLRRDTAWPDKSLPSTSSGPSLVCPLPSRNCPLTRHRSIVLCGHPGGAWRTFGADVRCAPTAGGAAKSVTRPESDGRVWARVLINDAASLRVTIGNSGAVVWQKPGNSPDHRSPLSERTHVEGFTDRLSDQSMETRSTGVAHGGLAGCRRCCPVRPVDSSGAMTDETATANKCHRLRHTPQAATPRRG